MNKKALLTHPQRALFEAFYSSLPILFSFLPLGFSFGYYGLQIGAPAHLVIAMSAIIYAGSVEFLVVNMLMALIPRIDILVAAALVNLRHVFYGLSVHQHYPSFLLKKCYMIHALSDETYSILAARREVDHTFSFWLSIFNHFYWVAGVCLGAITGHYLALEIKGIEFCLTALFIILVIEQALHVKKWFPFILAGLSFVLAKCFLPSQLLFASMVLVCGLLFIVYKLEEKKRWISQKLIK